MNQSGLVGPKFDFAGLDFLYRRGNIKGHGSRFGVGHQATRAEHLSQAPDGLHCVGSCDYGVVVGPVFLLDLFDHLFAANDICTCGFGLALLFPGGDNQHFLGPAKAMGKHHRTAHHLVGMLGIDAQAQSHLDGFIELGEFNFLKERHRFVELVRAGLNGRTGLGDVLSCFAHLFCLPPHMRCSAWP